MPNPSRCIKSRSIKVFGGRSPLRRSIGAYHLPEMSHHKPLAAGFKAVGHVPHIQTGSRKAFLA